MALDALTLSLLAKGLDTELQGTRVEKIHQPSKDEIVLHLRKRDGNLKLLVSARSGSARVCLTKENFENIIKCQMLKSWNRLKTEGFFTEDFPIGKQLGDPEELRDFILFGGGTTGEIVVNSKQNNKLIYDENVEYRTGARLYFDMRKIANDGLILRDGSEIKIKDSLPIKPYLIWVSTWDKIGLDSEISTPKIFAEKSDEFFKTNINKDFTYSY